MADGDEHEDFTISVLTGNCDSTPGDLPGRESVETPGAGINYATSSSSESSFTINSVEFSSAVGDCETVAEVAIVEVLHPEYVDPDTELDNLFDGDLDTYFSVHRESTTLTFELDEEQTVGSVSIGFYMKSADEERLQTFSISIKSDDDDEWTVVIDEQQSDGSMDMQTFSFFPQLTRYVRFESDGNNFNNWTPLTEIEICADVDSSSAVESNALFGVGGGVEAVTKDVNQLASEDDDFCPEPTKLAPLEVIAHGGDGATHLLVDENFETRWTTQNTYHGNDLENDRIQLHMGGEKYLSYVKVAFFDGQLANQYFSIYTEAAVDDGWTARYYNQTADDHERLQTFDVDASHVAEVFLVGRGNEQGNYTKISEIELFGC